MCGKQSIFWGTAQAPRAPTKKKKKKKRPTLHTLSATSCITQREQEERGVDSGERG